MRPPPSTPNSLAVRFGDRASRGPFRTHLEVDPAAPPARRAEAQILDADGQVVEVLRLTGEEAADEFAVEALAGRAAARLDGLNATWEGLLAATAAVQPVQSVRPVDATAPGLPTIPATPGAGDRRASLWRPRWASTEAIRALVVASFSIALIGGVVLRRHGQVEEQQRRAEERITEETAQSVQRDLARHFGENGTFAGFAWRGPAYLPENLPGGIRIQYDVVSTRPPTPATFTLRSRRGYTCAAVVGVTPQALAAPTPPECGWGRSAP